MLKCLAGFRHIKTANADLVAERMPLLEVFIQQFLLAVGSLVKRGLRSDYVARQDNLFVLRGRLLVARQISQNLVRRDRFFTEHDEFSQDRAENRLTHTTLRHVLTLCRSQESQRVARELSRFPSGVSRAGAESTSAETSLRTARYRISQALIDEALRLAGETR